MGLSSITKAVVFVGLRLAARGDLATVALAAHAHRDERLIIFDERTGQTIDLDLRGTGEEVLARLVTPTPAKPARGRPKLGVTAREVTLLPRHWDWLATQPGGASASLRRLVDQARRDASGADELRQSHEVTYRIMTTLAGDLANYEEATRALFANDRERFGKLTADWPTDIGDFVRQLSERADAPSA